MKNKLIELIGESLDYIHEKCDEVRDGCETDCPYWGGEEDPDRCARLLQAEFLIEHGVTIQRWIPVEERLPNANKWKYEYESVGVIVRIDGQKTTAYRIYERAVKRGKTVYRWKYPWETISGEKITHWMPLPEPPKEE